MLDLGSGAGLDCFVLSKLVGPNGHVTGVDMTPEQVCMTYSIILFVAYQFSISHSHFSVTHFFHLECSEHLASR